VTPLPERIVDQLRALIDVRRRRHAADVEAVEDWLGRASVCLRAQVASCRVEPRVARPVCRGQPERRPHIGATRAVAPPRVDRAEVGDQRAAPQASPGA
jgi:hypothetical protein